ncbi:MAG: peptide deformylase [Clostridia bacterium]|nr:peptide deformylase [Clostridia bacterium]
MALRNIRIDEDPVLRKKARTVEKFDPALHRLLEDMADTMYDAPGIGLAAPQVGVLKRAIVFDTGDGLMEMINPEITDSEGEQIEIEGCLSVPGIYGKVSRPASIKVNYQDRKGIRHTMDANELQAVVICHETDHLFGKLFTDIATEYITAEELEESGNMHEETL